MWFLIIFLAIVIIFAIYATIYCCKHHKSKDDLDDVDLDIIRRSRDKDSGLDDDD